MKQIQILSLLLFAAMTFFSCGDNDDEPTTVPQNPQPEATILPVTKYYSAEEFLGLFANRTWYEWQICDVYADGTTGSDILKDFDGYAPMTLKVTDNNSLNVTIKYADPHIAIHDTLLAYRFDEGNKFQLGNDDALYECYHSSMTVLEVNDTVMRCLGSVFAPNRNEKKEQKPVASLFLFHRR